MKEIEITIDKEGLTEIDLKGFQGKGCSEIIDQLIKGLQGEVIERSSKPEYYKPEIKPKLKQQN